MTLSTTTLSTKAGVGFGTVTIGAAKASNRKAMQKASRKSNRPSKTKTKSTSISRKSTLTRSADRKARKARSYRASIRKANSANLPRKLHYVALPHPARMQRVALPKPQGTRTQRWEAEAIVYEITKKVGVKLPPIPSIIESLEAKDAPMRRRTKAPGNHARNLEARRIADRALTSVLKAGAAGKKGKVQNCASLISASAVTADVAPQVHATLELITQAGYTPIVDKDMGIQARTVFQRYGVQSRVDHGRKVVEYTDATSVVVLAQLTHELVHILDHNGYEGIKTLSGEVTPFDAGFAASVQFDWTPGSDPAEDLAYSLMTRVQLVLTYADSVINPSSTTGEAATVQSVEVEISRPSVHSGTSTTPMTNATIFNNLTLSEKVAELEKLTMHPSLNACDLLWLGQRSQDLKAAIDEPINPLTGRETYNFGDMCVTHGVISKYLEKGLTPFPYWLGDQYDLIVFVGTIGCSNRDFGVAIRTSPLAAISRAATGKKEFMSGVLELTPSVVYNKVDVVDEVPCAPIAPYSAEEAKGKKVLYLSKDNNLAGCDIEVRSMEWMFAVSILKLLKTLTSEEMVDFISCFGAATKLDSLRVQLGKNHSSYSEVVFNFGEGIIEGSRTFNARHKGYLAGHGSFDANVFMCLIAMELVAFRSNVPQSIVDGKLAYLTQLWEEEDNYGEIMDSNQQLRVIRENTLAIVRIPFPGEFRSVMEERDYSHNGKFPYFKLWNNNSKDGVSEAIDWCIANGVEFFTDKNAMKRLVTGPGVAALYVSMDMEKLILKTIMDVKKAAKVLNRGWNSVAIQAMEGFSWQEGFNPYVTSKLVIRHKDGDVITDIRIKGDRKMTLTSDCTFLTNGSGVGNSNTIWPYSVPVRLRGSFNAINMRQGETVELVAAQIREELLTAMSEERILRCGRKRPILNYRGVDLLSYSGLNQDICIDPARANVKVRCLATSSTIEISATVFFFASDAEVKGRGQGIKASLRKADATNFTIMYEDATPVEWEVHLNSECLKGNSSRLGQWAESLGEDCFLNLADESIEVAGRTVDLTDIESEFYQWWEANTLEYVLEDDVDLHYFSFLALGHSGSTAYAPNEDNTTHTIWPVVGGTPIVNWNKLWAALQLLPRVEVVGATDAASLEAVVVAADYKCFRVREKVRGVLAPLVYQVELASVRECSSAAQNSTLQQLLSIYVSNPQLAYASLYGSVANEQAVMGVVASAMNDPSLLKLEQREMLSELGKGYETWIGNYRITPEEIWTKLNPGTFGIAGPKIYKDLSADPFLEFSKPTGKKFEKKLLTSEVGITNTLLNGEYNLLEVIEGTSWNYQVNVGTGYNMGSVALTMATIHRFAHFVALANGDEKGAEVAYSKLASAIRVCYMCWIESYENSWLCGWGKNGMALADALHQARKGYTLDEKGQVNKGLTQLKADIAEKLSAISGVHFGLSHVGEYLKTFQIARGISHLERYDVDGTGDKTAKSFGFSKDDMLLLALAGACRRCDQGRYANYVDPVDENEGAGTSVWSLLISRWDECQNLIPYFLRRKVFKAMVAHVTLAETRRGLDDMKDQYGKPKESSLAHVNTVSNAYGASTFVKLKDTDQTIPFVDAENAFDANGKSLFQWQLLACPLTKEGFQDTTVEPIKRINNAKGVWEDTWGFAPVLLMFEPRARSAEDLLKLAHTAFPNGVIVLAGSNTTNEGEDLGVFLHFGSILRAGAIMTGGSSTGVGLRVASFIIGISRDPAKRPEKSFTSYCRNMIASIGGMLRGLISGGLMKRIARSEPNTQGAKVRTSHNCPDTLFGDYSLPTIRMNPADELVWAGKYENGHFVSVGRTPQLAEIYGVLVLDETVAIGFIEVSAVLWAQANRGDGDGDGITIKNLSYLVNDRAEKALAFIAKKRALRAAKG